MTATIAATEATLCRILAEVLKVDLVHPQDGFFEVGGDSVLAVAVVARAREAGLVLGVRDLFDHQTAQALAAVIGDGASGSSANSAAESASSTRPVRSFGSEPPKKTSTRRTVHARRCSVARRCAYSGRKRA